MRDEAAVHSSHGPVEDDRRHKTYIVATYTGELDDHDKHERWYVRRPPRPDMDLDDEAAEAAQRAGVQLQLACARPRVRIEGPGKLYLIGGNMMKSVISWDPAAAGEASHRGCTIGAGGGGV